MIEQGTLSEQEIIKELNDILMKTEKTEKHRGYHILPERLNKNITDEHLKSHSVFYEKERMTYFRSYVDFKNKSILDIGCNTGYFLFGTLDDGATNVTGYEGKTSCNEFLEKAIELLGEEKRFRLVKKYFDFSDHQQNYDIIFLLNVLHHVGDDYGDKLLTISDARNKIIEQLNILSKNTSILIYQMGFNWQGNIKRCLFPNGLKSEMIDFLKKRTKNHWDVIAIGIAVKNKGGIIYKNLN
ncbi:MAG: class I SAM-dependent methyltransferase, partial [Bacteroidota bacterium]